MAIGAILGALMSGLGVAAEASAIGGQQNLGWANLFEQRRSNREREKLAKSARTDPRGNRVYFDPTFGWQIDLAPGTQQILDAEDRETLLSLTEDAARNREAARRMEGRSEEADELFEELFNEYRYRPKKSEAEYVGDAQREKLLARRKGSDEAAAAINRALIRQGNSSNVGAVFNAARDAEADEFEEVLLGGKRQGIQDFLNIEGGKDQALQQELGFLEAIANNVTNMPQRFTNRAGELSGTADDATSELLSVLAQSQGNEQGAVNALMQALGQSPNFAPFASSLSRLGDSFAGAAGGGGAASGDRLVSYGAPYPRPYEEGVRARLRAGF